MLLLLYNGIQSKLLRTYFFVFLVTAHYKKLNFIVVVDKVQFLAMNIEIRPMTFVQHPAASIVQMFC